MKESKKQIGVINWTAVHERIEAAQAVATLAFNPSLEEKKRILKARARSLAQAPEEQSMAGQYLEVVEFLLAHETYGLESSCVREVYPLKSFTPLPCTPSFVVGIMNVRGKMLSVIDLKKFFELPEKGLTDLNKVVILRNDKMEFGILADAVLGVSHVLSSELQPTLPTLSGRRVDYLKGVTRERLVILDGAKLLSDASLIVRENVKIQVNQRTF